MNETTLGENPALEEAFAAFVQAQENGKAEDARKLLRDHPGLAEEVAMYYALCTRVPKPWDSSVNSLDGRTLGDFELLHEVGRGGEGVVYKARQRSLQTVVAVKVMRHERFASRSDVERFRRDYLLLASLDHPNIVRILYAGESDTGPYFAMEMMTESLKDKRANGWLPTPRQAAELVRVLAEAMEYAHEKKIVHRDLKPANILLKPDGTPKIVDFGLAKKLDEGHSTTISGAIVGTASYMAPEQATGQRADFPCDIYGLGAILYELLTGRPPFVGTTLLETLEHVREREPLPVGQLNPNVARDLEVICLKCLDKAPTKRYSSAAELAADLQRFLDGEPIKARLPGLTEQAFRVLLAQKFHNVIVWGRILVITGIINSCFYLAGAWLIASMQPPSVNIPVMVAHNLAIIAVHWWCLRGCQLKVGDRRALAFTAAAIVGSVLIPVFYRPPDGIDLPALMAYRLSLFPLFAVIQGILFFAQGPIFWGGFYVYGASYIALAFVMMLLPAWSPLLFAFFTAATLIPLGWYMLRLEQSPDFNS